MKEIDLLIKNANEIVTFESDGPLKGEGFGKKLHLKTGDIAIHQGKIVAMDEDLCTEYQSREEVDAAGMTVLPGFVDPHTHLPHYGSRHRELETKISGQSSYADVHRGGGGILYTVSKTREASFEELVEKGFKDLDLMLAHGTTTIEAKSGYGLSREDELKLLRVIAELDKIHPMTIVPTFLGAHTVPPDFKDNRAGYVQLVKNLMPEVKNLAVYCDVFCDPLGFDKAETREILEEALKHGLTPRIHIDQTGNANGGELALEIRAVSVSHADYTSNKALERMASEGVYVELLPGVTYHLAEATKGGKCLKDFWPERARKMIDLGIPITISTDYNPGSSRIHSMPAVMQHGSRLYRMNFAELIEAATINAAHSIGVGQERGNIQIGKMADLVVMDVPEYGQIIDISGANLVKYVIKDGNLVVHNNPILHKD